MTFWSNLESHSGRVAFREAGGASITYAQLARAADSLTNLPSGSLLLLSLDNSIGSMIAYLGALRLGLAAIIINASDGAAADRISSRFRPRAHWSPTTGLVACSDGQNHAVVHPELAVLLSTSGSTGTTKLVRLSARAVDANALSIAQYLEIGEADRAITTLPPGYCYGLSVLNSHLAAGASTILFKGSVLDPQFRTIVEAERATSIAGVPHTYELLERTGFIENLPLSIRTLTQAGGKLPPDRVIRLNDHAKAAGARFFTMYGQTEATARMAYLPPEKLPEFSDCIGEAIPGGHFDLVDPVSGAVASTSGELVYSGPNVMMGYAENASDLGRGHDLDRLHTGDLAERTPSGLFRITGRRSRFIKLFGLRIALDEAENVLREEGVEAVATGDDQILVIAITDSAKAAQAETVITERFGIPYSHYVIMPVQSVPRLPTGKIDYLEIARTGKVVRDREPLRKKSRPQDALAATLRSTVARSLRRDRVESTDSFISLGGDSLSYVEVSMAIEDALGYLPASWEELSIGHLETLAITSEVDAKRRHRWISIDILIRPIMMGLIVAAHVASVPIQGGALALFILAGQVFQKFQGHRLQYGPRISILWTLFTRLILPYYAVFLLYILTTSNRPGLPSLLLINNSWRDPGITTMVSFWYIQALFQCYFGTVLLFCIPAVRKFASNRAWTFAVALLIFSLLLREAVLLGFAGGSLSPSPYSTEGWAYAFALGWLVSQADTALKRFAAVAATYGCTAFIWGFGDSHSLIATAVVLAVLVAPRIRLWRPAANAIVALAQATLFIYLFQGIAINIVKVRLNIPSIAVNIVAAAAFGLLAYLGWELLLRYIRRGARGIRVGAALAFARRTFPTPSGPVARGRPFRSILGTSKGAEKSRIGSN